MEKNQVKTVATPLLSSHGTFMYGKLDEIDFTVAGKNDTMKWGHSVKLKFIVTKMVEKELNGRTIQQPKTVFEYMSIDCDSEDDIDKKYRLFTDLIGQEILVPIVNNKEKTTYKINDENLVIIKPK